MVITVMGQSESSRMDYCARRDMALPRHFTCFPQIVCLPWLLGLSAVSMANSTITPRIELTGIYSDNIRLTKDDKESDYITNITPGISLNHEGGRVKTNIDYQVQNLIYANEGKKTSTNHQLDGLTAIELSQELLYVDADVSVYQRVVDPEDNAPLDNINLSNNRSDVFTANITPYLQRRFGDIESVARYRYGVVNYSGSDDKDNLIDSKIYDASILAGNLAEQAKVWTWQLAYNYQRIDYENDVENKFQNGIASIGYRFSGNLQFLLDGGVDDNNFQSEGQADTSGAFWNVGLRWDPGRKNHFEAGFGRRYSGDKYNVLWVRKTNRVDIDLSYSVTLDTNAGITSSNKKVDNEGSIGNELSDSFRADSAVFRRKLFSGNSTVNWSKSRLTFGLSHERREDQDTNIEDEISIASGAWDWRYTTRTSFILNLLAERRDFGDSDQVDKIWRASTGFRHDLGTKTQASLLLTHSRQESDSVTSEYRENRASLSILRIF